MIYAKCPDCGSVLIKRKGSWGEFYGCSSYPSCKKTVKVALINAYMVEADDTIEDEVDKVSTEISTKEPVFSKESPITDLGDEERPTSDFSLLRFKFGTFNPVQIKCMEYYDKDINFVVAVPTSTGKTTICEMFMAHSLAQGKRVAYVSPLKALTKEKYDDWTDPSHDWSSLNISILTGDYSLSEEKIKELDNANIILMTNEMLVSRSRKMNSEKSRFLKEIGTLVIDEVQLISTESRGSACEVGIMKFTEINQDCRIVFLSATMPNVIDMCSWLTKLNGKKTEIVNSDKRNVPLSVNWVTYEDGDRFVNDRKMNIAMKLTEEYPDDNFILFVHSKATGRNLLRKFKDDGIDAEFHCADLSKEERGRIEKEFRDKELRILIATSTIAWGINC